MYKYLAVLLISLMFFGCGDSGSDSSSQSINLKISEVKVPSDEVNAGHSVDVEYTLISDAVQENVTVSFYLVHHGQFVAQEEDTVTPQAEQYYIGSDTSEIVIAGENRRVARLFVPDTVITEGQYFIVAHVDSGEIIAETNEDDNMYSTYDTSRADSTVLTLSTDYADVTNLKVSELVLDSKALMLTPEDYDSLKAIQTNLSDEFPRHANAHLNGYAVFKMDGDPLTPAQLADIKVKSQIQVGGIWRDVYLWNSVLEKYETYVNLDVLEREQGLLGADTVLHRTERDIVIHYEISIPVAVAAEIIDEIAADIAAGNTHSFNKFSVRLLLDSENSVAELSEDDNSVQTSVEIFYVSDAGRDASDYLLEKNYALGVGDKSKVRIELDYYGKNGLENGPKYGGILKNEISVPIYVFNKSSELLSVSDQHSAYVNSPGDTGYTNEIKFLGVVLYADELWYDHITKDYEKSWSKEQELASVSMCIGPVPVTLKTGVNGSVAFTMSFTLSVDPEEPILSSDNDLPKVDFDLYGSAGVGGAGFSAGPIVTFIVLEEVLNLYAYTDVGFDVSVPKFTSATTGMTIKNDMEAVKGKIGVYVEYPTVKWCKKWGVPYPCGKKTAREEKYFYETGALYNKTYTIYDNSKTWDF